MLSSPSLATTAVNITRCRTLSLPICSAVLNQTRHRFCSVRGSQNKAVSQVYQPASAHIVKFEELIGTNNVIHDSFDIEKYTVDWTKVYKGGTVVCLPTSTEDVSSILRYCNANMIGVVPQGGNTGLVGGAVGLTGNRGDQVIMSMERMKTVRSISDSVLVCDAGCILETLNNECNKNGYMVPLDLGAKGACMIGGNVATNAGGLRVVRYGTLHSSILGLEVVQADGTVLDMLRTLRKDNCGYHLPHLFIGSEGTLGVITKVAIALALKPTSTAVVWAKVSAFSMLPLLLHRAKAEVGEILSAFEFLDIACLGAIRKTSPHLLRRVQSSVLPAAIQATKGLESGIEGEICVLMEFSSCSSTSESSNLNRRLESFLEGLIEDELVQDALVSQSVEQEKDLWTIREDLPVCLMQRSRSSAKTDAHAAVHAHAGVIDHADLNAGADTGASRDAGGGADVDAYVSTQCIKLYKYDVSLSLRDTEAMVLQVKKEMAEVIHGTAGHTDFPTGLSLEFCCFGHAGDQNLHLNILLHVPSIYALELREDLKNSIQIPLNNAVFKAVLSLHGSVSAEHGVGQQKREIMNLARSPAELLLMASIKRTLDPNGILNPGKVLPDGY